jgi:alkanesulfonate monooxygenase SsuD/methylene tetrahydromethanopterin reductase-like flavin-dependent oxidoreductase (luciferase family)
VVRRLWDSWEDDFEVVDRASGVYSDPTKVHAIDHAGRFFKVRGPLNLPRSPQAYPLLVQAGSSPTGQAFAARHRPAVLLVTHDVDEAIVLADRVLVLVDGHIAVDQEIELPQPRSHRDPRFLEHRHRLLTALGVE